MHTPFCNESDLNLCLPIMRNHTGVVCVQVAWEQEGHTQYTAHMQEEDCGYILSIISTSYPVPEEWAFNSQLTQ